MGRGRGRGAVELVRNLSCGDGERVELSGVSLDVGGYACSIVGG